MIKVITFENEEKLDQFVANAIMQVVHEKAHPVIGFATGSTPQGTYEQLIKAYQNKEVDFTHTTAFNLDEYVGMNNDHPCSFAKAMRDTLFDHINISTNQIHALQGDAIDMNEECKKYDEAIAKEPIDIQLLGIGMDGHIAYNEPGTSFESTTHVVDLHPESIQSSLNYGFDRIEDVPRRGVSQGIQTIMMAKQLIMIAKGSKKAELVKRMLEGSVDEQFPSSIIQRHENVLVVLDVEAAKLLQEGTYEKR